MMHCNKYNVNVDSNFRCTKHELKFNVRTTTKQNGCWSCDFSNNIIE